MGIRGRGLGKSGQGRTLANHVLGNGKGDEPGPWRCRIVPCHWPKSTKSSVSLLRSNKSRYESKLILECRVPACIPIESPTRGALNFALTHYYLSHGLAYQGLGIPRP